MQCGHNEYMKGFIGVARILSAGVHFFLKKFTTFLVVLLNIQPKTAKLTTPTLTLSRPANIY